MPSLPPRHSTYRTSALSELLMYDQVIESRSSNSHTRFSLMEIFCWKNVCGGVVNGWKNVIQWVYWSLLSFKSDHINS